ncbi:MAG: response regulator transcription factor [Acidimicrobiia bacterium]|nr:response regulator transcription factor [Acidimicrobiia bacterium]
MTSRVLLVEDDAIVRDAVALVLERQGFSVTPVADGADAIEEGVHGGHDLIVLDLMLPTVDGLEVCREVRKTSRVPIVMLTARADTNDVVAGLELGADDYVTKPFEPAVLAARIRSVLRRSDDDNTPAGIDGVLAARGITVDVESQRAFRGEEELLLTRTEWRLLVELLSNAAKVLTREHLLEAVWGYDYLGDSRLVDMAVKRLRDKLGEPDRPPSYVTTVRGVGYRFERD